MTDRERFLRVMRFEPVDRPPFVGDGPWPQTIERWKKEGLPEDGDVEKFFGITCLQYKSYPGDTFLVPPFEPREIRSEKDFVIRTDCFGATIKDYKDHMTMPQWLDYAVKTPENLLALVDRLRPDFTGRMPDDWAARKEPWREDTQSVGVAMGGSYYGNLRNLMGVERISMMFYDAPEAVEKYLDAYTEVVLMVLKRACGEVAVDCLNFYEDFAYKTSSLISPAVFRRFLFPRYKKVIDYAKIRGIDIFYIDSDGNINGLLDDLLECGINLIYPVECAADMDPRTLRAKYGKRLRMIGGIDKRALTRGKQAIRDEVLGKVPALIAEGGYIPKIDHSVASDVPFENYCYYINCLKEIYGLG